MKQNNSGFTLMELMIVIVVVSILAAIAVPSYQDYVTRSRRSDAKAGITEVQLAEEKWRANNTAYTTAIVADLGLTIDSPDDYYDLSVTAADATTYTIRATADPSEAQKNDSTCVWMEINHNGTKTSSPGSPDECW